MIDSRSILNSLVKNGVLQAIGVPDSTLQPFIGALEKDNRIQVGIATNECEAISIAAGNFLGSGIPSLVYLQNSGFGKTIHPLTSLLSGEICRIPALLLIGWRGCPEPGSARDEPQHVKMGKSLIELLGVIDVPHQILSSDEKLAAEQIQTACAYMRENRTAYALLVKPGLFGKDEALPAVLETPHPKRREVLESLVSFFGSKSVFISTTGKASRELYAIRDEAKASHDQDFYVVGGMGCASSIGLGFAQSRPDAEVCVIDGDGAALMQLGTLATIGNLKPKRFLHVVIDNGAHESTGGQKTVSNTARISEIARACGYEFTAEVSSLLELNQTLNELFDRERSTKRIGPKMIVVKSSLGSDPKLMRPTQTPEENTSAFLRRNGLR